jgi:hypothetical protein
MKKMLGILVGVLMLTGCGDPPPSVGYVYAKHFYPAYYYSSNDCYAYDTKGNCSFSMWTTHYMPESFDLCLVDDKDPKHKGCFNVDIDVYEKFEVNTHFPNPM